MLSASAVERFSLATSTVQDSGAPTLRVSQGHENLSRAKPSTINTNFRSHCKPSSSCGLFSSSGPPSLLFSSAIMLVYQDLLTGDELLSDSFPYKEIENGVLWEVEGKWVVQGAVDVDIGANPSAEGGEDDECVDDQSVKVVDIVDTFRLQEQPSFDKKQFVTYMKRYIKLLTPKLEGEQQEQFKKNIEGATKFLLSKLKDLQFFVGESMHDDGSLVFAYYKEGATDPTFLYFGHGLREVKC